MQNKAAYVLRETALDDLAHASDAEFAILMIDVNFLKRVNDTYGHEKGDQYLLAAADLVRRIADDKNAFRFGGDEFVVLLEDDDARGADAVAARLAEEVASMQADDSLEAWQRVPAAVGAATFDPTLDHCVEDVLKRADAAMYESKKAMKAERHD